MVAQFIAGIFNRIIGLMVAVAAPLCVIFIFFGAYKILFAGGDDEKMQSGWKTIIAAIIGYGLVLILPGMPTFIQNFLGQ